MTDESFRRRRRGSDGVDPRFDPAFQRGYGGDVAAAPHPDAGPLASRGVAPGPDAVAPPAAHDPEDPPASEIGSFGFAPLPQTWPPTPRAALWSNPWILAMIALGIVSTAAGLALVYWAVTTPNSELGAETNVVVRNLAFYASIPLIGGLPLAIFLSLAVAALRWVGRPASDDLDGVDDPDGRSGDGTATLLD